MQREEALIQYPWIDPEGIAHEDLIMHYAPEGKKVICEETGGIYCEAVDKYPCSYHYYVYEEEPEDENRLETETDIS